MIWRHRSGGVFLILLFASLCARAQTSQPATAKVETKTGAITGRVVNENGGPHVNVDVWVRPDTPEGLPVTHTTTNREGVFKLSGLEPGSYNVSAIVPAHIPKSPTAGPIVYKTGDPVTLVLAKGGIVTGTVTNAKGDPIVGIGVRVHMIRDESGRDFGYAGRYYANTTDDRGVYRVYGIPTGTYVVSTDGSADERSSIRVNINGFANDLPTYAPSSNREDADELSVRIGEEVSNVNIRYRGERGSTISGILNGLIAGHTGFWVTLTSIVERGPRWSNPFRATDGGEFAFDAIPDGDYHIVAATDGNDRTRRQSESLLLHVRGADIEGLQLTALPLASITGRVVLEALKAPPPECTDKREPPFSDISVTAWQRVTEGARKKPQFVWRAGGSVTPNVEGKLAIQNIAASEYYFAVRYSAQQWFLQSIAFAPPNGKPADVTRTWTTVKPGDQLSDLTFTLAQGAGSVNGVISPAPGQTLPEKFVAFLVPAEPEQAEDVLRYFAVPVNAEGRFWLSQVAPGRYWVFAGAGTDDTRYEVSKMRLPDGTATRSSLREAAAVAKTEIEIKPCQDLTLALPQK